MQLFFAFPPSLGKRSSGDWKGAKATKVFLGREFHSSGVTTERAPLLVPTNQIFFGGPKSRVPMQIQCRSHGPAWLIWENNSFILMNYQKIKNKRV